MIEAFFATPIHLTSSCRLYVAILTFPRTQTANLEKNFAI